MRRLCIWKGETEGRTVKRRLLYGARVDWKFPTGVVSKSSQATWYGRDLRVLWDEYSYESWSTFWGGSAGFAHEGISPQKQARCSTTIGITFITRSCEH